MGTLRNTHLVHPDHAGDTVSNITRDSWSHFFPFKQPRPEQEEAINFILRSFIEDGKRFVIADLGTGIGKSAIAVTVSRYLTAHCPPDVVQDLPGEEPVLDSKPGAWFLTTQKILQEQYLDDFGGAKGCMRDIKSASNYKCSYYKKLSCSEGQSMLRSADKASKFWKSCMFNCNYKLQRKSFLEAPESVTNFSYALTEANYSGKITKRGLLVIDECHNAENELCRFIEATVSDRSAAALGLEWPEINTYAQALKWVKETYLPAAKTASADMERDCEDFKQLEGHEKEYGDLVKRLETLKGHVAKLVGFIQCSDPDNWIVDILPPVGKMSGKITFKPIDVSPYTEQNLFRLGKRVLLMSATVINTGAFAEALGIPKEAYAAITMPTPFPVANRPIYFHPIGRMTADNIDDSLPKVAAALREILKEHKGDKGIIHCHSYKIVTYLRKHLKSDRLIFHDAHDRDAALAKHIADPKPTVLVSPSMSEGVDLRDNLARFQILLKVPYPSLGDKIVKKRMHRWKWWYPLQTVKTIVQSVGRGVRSETDHAVTYILDADWNRFYGQNREMFPQSFRDAVQK